MAKRKKYPAGGTATSQFLPIAMLRQPLALSEIMSADAAIEDELAYDESDDEVRARPLSSGIFLDLDISRPLTLERRASHLAEMFFFSGQDDGRRAQGCEEVSSVGSAPSFP